MSLQSCASVLNKLEQLQPASLVSTTVCVCNCLLSRQ